jgi:FtsP/CotA-like multicopper oxidase with cupredoxin domain
MRRWVLAGLSATTLLCGLGVGGVTWLIQGQFTNTVGKVDFDRPLAVPPLALSTVDAQGRRVFNLTAGFGQSDFGHGRTETWGYNGKYLGPTLRASRGEQVLVNVHNRLAEDTTVHWHGMHLPARMDGGPADPIAPGDTWSPTWTVDQPAATLWYHPHPHETTEKQVYNGLAGLFIVDDPATDVAALPHEYGVDDIPVIVQDKTFAGDGDFDRGHGIFSDIGVLGDTILVNGTVGPYQDVTTQRVRLRLLNASTARIYDFGFADGRSFDLVGTDGGLLSAPYAMKRLKLSVGERAEIVVPVRPGERVTLRSFPVGPDWTNGGRDEFDVLQLRAAAVLKPSPAVPERLVDRPRLDPASAVRERDFTFQGRKINGHKMAMNRVDAVITKGTTEIWAVRNGHDTPHSFHIHDVQFQVLSVDGSAPPGELSGWKDTIFLPPHEEIKVIARFADYADPTTAYMFHCHVLMHEDEGMMGRFIVVDPDR